ncbi:MAG: hypothetical protein DRQ37_08250 [Gammaproteobacteria bacterium]|nr:MAG: hypothetical protein DRQ37_08250 [Gammaproteobacteria bacterium]
MATQTGKRKSPHAPKEDVENDDVYGDEILSAGWNPAVEELLNTVARRAGKATGRAPVKGGNVEVAERPEYPRRR